LWIGYEATRRRASESETRGPDSFNVSLPRRAGVELRPGSEVDVRRCWDAALVCIDDESVDQSEARNVAGFGPDDRDVRRGGTRARRPIGLRPRDRTDRGRRYGPATASA
jgi:hypothetical protein